LKADYVIFQNAALARVSVAEDVEFGFAPKFTASSMAL
jgi:hypothetical protein